MERFSKEFEAFYGAADIDKHVDTIKEAFTLAADIRQKLGKKGYILESYLSDFLNGVLTGSTVPNVFADDELIGVVRHAMEGKADGNPFYDAAKSYIDAHPLSYQEQATRHSLYSAALLGDYLKYKADEHWAKLSDRFSGVLDTAAFDQQYEEISALIGSKPMEKLEALLQWAFLFITPMDVFIRDMNTALLHNLLYRDQESSRLTLGLWLDMMDEAAR